MAPTWPYSDAPNTAVFTTDHVMRMGEPILSVAHDIEDGAWQFHTGRPASATHSMIVGLAEMLAHDPTLCSVMDLPQGWRATRSVVGGEWTRSVSEALKRLEKSRRRKLKSEFRKLKTMVSTVLQGEDPIGLLALGAPPDEYDAEVGTILPRLKTAASAIDVQRIVHEEFASWFGLDIAGDESAYVRVAEKIWAALAEGTRLAR